MAGEHPRGLQDLLVARLLAIPDGEITATAKRADMSLHQLLRLRRGENANVTLSTLERLALALREPASSILTEKNGKAQPPPRRIDPRVVRRAVKKLAEIRGVVDALADELSEDD